MANNKPLTSDEKLEIVEVLKRGNLSHRAVAKQFNRSQSTVSQIARDAGITPTHRRRRTPAAKDIGGSFGGRERIKLADSVLGVISEMIKGGGHSPRELKDITQALKLALEARRAEDLPETDEAKKDEIEYVDTPLGDLKLPRTPQFADIIWELEHGDPDTYMERRFAAEKEERAEQEHAQEVEDK